MRSPTLWSGSARRAQGPAVAGRRSEPHDLRDVAIRCATVNGVSAGPIASGEPGAARPDAHRPVLAGGAYRPARGFLGSAERGQGQAADGDLAGRGRPAPSPPRACHRRAGNVGRTRPSAKQGGRSSGTERRVGRPRCDGIRPAPPAYCTSRPLRGGKPPRARREPRPSVPTKGAPSPLSGSRPRPWRSQLPHTGGPSGRRPRHPSTPLHRHGGTAGHVH